MKGYSMTMTYLLSESFCEIQIKKSCFIFRVHNVICLSDRDEGYWSVFYFKYRVEVKDEFAWCTEFLYVPDMTCS